MGMGATVETETAVSPNYSCLRDTRKNRPIHDACRSRQKFVRLTGWSWSHGPILGGNRCGCYANSRIPGGFSKTWQITPRCNLFPFRLMPLP